MWELEERKIEFIELVLTKKGFFLPLGGVLKLW